MAKLWQQTEQLQKTFHPQEMINGRLGRRRKYKIKIRTKGVLLLTNCGFNSDTHLLSKSVWVSETLTQ